MRVSRRRHALVTLGRGFQSAGRKTSRASSTLRTMCVFASGYRRDCHHRQCACSGTVSHQLCWNVVEQELEKKNVASANPAIVKRLMNELETYTANAYAGGLDLATTTEDAYCVWIVKVGWVQPFDPLPPVA
jgi:hypothetical protein